MSDTGDNDRERSPLHEHRDSVFDVDNRDKFRPRVRRSSVVSGVSGPLVSCVYFACDQTPADYNYPDILNRDPFMIQPNRSISNYIHYQNEISN